MADTMTRGLSRPGLSLLAGGMVRFHCRMSRKTRRMVKTTLLGVAATALTVKGALASPLGVVAEGPLDKLKQNVDEKKEQALTQSRNALDQAGARLVGGIVPPLPTGSPPPSRRGDANQAKPSNADTAPELTPGPPYRRAFIRRVLIEAAQRHQLDPKLVLALSYWESGWDQTRLSASGAVGLMQVLPATAAEAGPGLLGRPIDLDDPYDNADVGAAILREDLDNFKDPTMALAAYYQGPTSLRENGMFPDTQQYVQGILDLAGRMS
ncbi:MAG: lytic transglycosylase domain-containing protein [Chloroflexi bacterium]|nr:MAG: lytic transglycosylase domain-containing protein [Chloroflexota bacterium]